MRVAATAKHPRQVTSNPLPVGTSFRLSPQEKAGACPGLDPGMRVATSLTTLARLAAPNSASARS